VVPRRRIGREVGKGIEERGLASTGLQVLYEMGCSLVETRELKAEIETAL
jgi:hypothetical protein